MQISTSRDQAFLTLLIIHIMMAVAFFFQIEPHPPQTTPAFGMGPFLSAMIAIIVLAITMPESQIKNALAIVIVILSCASYGPHKWLDPAAPLIWPALIVAQASMIFITYQTIIAIRNRRTS